MYPKFDLLGDPIPDSRGKAGRTGHIATAENTSKIRTLLVAGMKLEQIAREMGITVPTIRKHYFANGRLKAKDAREWALAEARAKNLLQLQAEADRGNVSAIKAMDKVLDRCERRILDDDAAMRDRPSKPMPKGKKHDARTAALEAETELEELMNREARLN